MSSSAKLAKSEDATGGFAAADDDDHDDDDDDNGGGADNLLHSWPRSQDATAVANDYDGDDDDNKKVVVFTIYALLPELMKTNV